ncbi:hypothetical protein [Hugenholtzia roseola]|uniref:hypothetical protein n=1 Tax=Hugenholtzia roseola TaxID=1002 RepID=UPI00040694E3|nr:hypothetical protein [Hugenholtzia roseola]
MKKIFLLAFSFCFFSGSILAQNISMWPWRMHYGGKKVIAHQNPVNGDPSAYAKMSIPGTYEGGWENAPLNANGEIVFGGSTASVLNDCRKSINFTYFETVIEVPKNVSVSQLMVTFEKVDDGARAYIFNSKYPNGTFKGQIKYGDAPKTEDYKDFVVAGEKNRIVIVQFDDCATGNNLRGAKVVVNGQALKASTAASGENVATVYEHYDYGGKSQVLSEGFYEIDKLTIGNDIISSIKVKAGWKVTLYEHYKGTGKAKVITADTRALEDFNDVVSSIRVERIK